MLLGIALFASGIGFTAGVLLERRLWMIRIRDAHAAIEAVKESRRREI